MDKHDSLDDALAIAWAAALVLVSAACNNNRHIIACLLVQMAAAAVAPCSYTLRGCDLLMLLLMPYCITYTSCLLLQMLCMALLPTTRRQGLHSNILAMSWV